MLSKLVYLFCYLKKNFELPMLIANKFKNLRGKGAYLPNVTIHFMSDICSLDRQHLCQSSKLQQSNY